MKKNIPQILLAAALAVSLAFLFVLNKQNSQISAQLSQAQDSKAKLMHAVNELEVSLMEQAGLLAEDNKIGKEKVERLMLELKKVQNGSDETERLKSMLEKNLDKCSRALSDKESENLELATKINQLTLQIHDLSNWVSSSEKKLKDLGERYEIATVRMGEMTGELERQRNVCDAMIKELKLKLKDQRITIEVSGGSPKLTILGKVLFDFSEIQITREGRKILKDIGEVLKEMNKEKIVVSGHADNIPLKFVNRYGFKSNWEISTARATEVVRFFQEVSGIKPDFMTATGHSFYHPVGDSATSHGRSLNRRVEIMILPPEK